MEAEAIMRLVLLFLLAIGCDDPYADAEKINTVEGWESFLASDPGDSDRLNAETKLEALLVEKATGSTKVEDYDAVIKRFPKSRSLKKMQEGRANAAYAIAEQENTAASWQKFLDENPNADGTQKKKATARVQMASYQDKLTIGDVKVEEVNLAEDPKGPKDGWGFTAEITNSGDKTLDYLNMEIQLLDAGGAKLKAMSYPAAAQSGPGGMPLPEATTKPFAPGEKRVWTYSTGEVPEGWSKQVRLVPVAVRFSGAPATAADTP
jgi:hypothetical protein